MAVKIFFCYAHEDEALLNKLKTHLRPLQRQGLIDVWHDRDISAGSDWEREISLHLNEANIILLLISPDFMDSDYCYGIEMKRAIERHERGETVVIPIILRHVYWQGVLGKLQALPTDAKPIISSAWYNVDEALFDVTNSIRNKAEQLILTIRFKEAYQNDDDDEIIVIYDEIQRSPNKELITFTEKQLERVTLAREAQGGIEQLWYTWTERGLASIAGYQIRAASKGIQNSKNERIRVLGNYLHYQLPLGTNIYDIDPMIAPISLAFILTEEGERILVNRSYIGKDGRGRTGAFFCHLLSGLPKEFSSRDAIRLWGSTLWQTSDVLLPPHSYTLPKISLQDLDRIKRPFGTFFRQASTRVQDLLHFLIQAYLVRKGNQQIFIAAPTDEIASAIFGLTLSLPQQLLTNLTFSTYEFDVRTANEQIIGTCWLGLPAPAVSGFQDLPRFCYENGIALNCFTGSRSDLIGENSLAHSYATFATESLLHSSSPFLRFIESASTVNDVDDFLSHYKKEPKSRFDRFPEN